MSVLNEGSLAIVGDHLETFSSSARDTLIVYYAGHGVLGADGELYLALVDTQVDRLPWTAVPISALKRLIAASPAENRVLILDCCFSGRAIETMTEMQSALSSQTVISGAYTLTSAPPNSPSMAPARSQYTAFTGELIGVLRDGAPGEPELLTLGTVYKVLRANLAARGLPLPQQRNTENAHLLALAPNRASGRTRRRPDYLLQYGSLWRNAHDGDVEAMYRLSVLLRYDKFDDDAAAWLQEAARLRHDNAMVDYACMLEAAGRADEAELWFRRGADGGDHYAGMQAAIFLEKCGQVTAAVHLLRRLAQAGDSAAMKRLAGLLKQEGDSEEAARWAGEAAIPEQSRGRSDATGYTMVGPIWRTSPVELMRQAKDADSVTATEIAFALEIRGLLDEAGFFYRRSAEAGNSEAMYRLAMMLEELRRNDDAENWYRSAAERGHGEAMVKLGLALQRRRSPVGEEWLYRSASAGDLEGMFHWAAVLKRRNRLDDAMHWYQAAARRGHAAAMDAMGSCSHAAATGRHGTGSNGPPSVEWSRR